MVGMVASMNWELQVTSSSMYNPCGQKQLRFKSSMVSLHCSPFLALIIFSGSVSCSLIVIVVYLSPVSGNEELVDMIIVVELGHPVSVSK
jgi:hypothetical protein